MEVENVYPGYGATGVRAGPQAHCRNGHPQVRPVGCFGPFFAPLDSTTLLGIVGDALPPCRWGQAGHVDDAVLKHNHHGALPDPQSHQESNKQHRWEEDGRNMEMSPVDLAKLVGSMVSSPSHWRWTRPEGVSPTSWRQTSADGADRVKRLCQCQSPSPLS